MTQQVLLDSFLAYLSRDKRALVVHAFELTVLWMNTMTSGLISYIDSNISELQSLSRDTILEIAHKERIQACQYIIDIT